MLFVRQATRIPIPNVYAFFRDEASDLEVLIQEYIPGEFLGEAWGRLNQQGKDAMAMTLRGYFDDLRRIPSSGYFGSPWRQPIVEPRLCGSLSSSGIRSLALCETEEQWVELMMNAASRVYPLSAVRTDFERNLLQATLRRDRPSVSTHGHFGWGNARVRNDGVIVIVDWDALAGIQCTGNSILVSWDGIVRTT